MSSGSPGNGVNFSGSSTTGMSSGIPLESLLMVACIPPRLSSSCSISSMKTSATRGWIIESRKMVKGTAKPTVQSKMSIHVAALKTLAARRPGCILSWPVTICSSPTAFASATGGANVAGSKASSGASSICPPGPEGSLCLAATRGRSATSAASAACRSAFVIARVSVYAPFLPLTNQPKTSKYSTALNFMGSIAPLSCSVIPHDLSALQSQSPLAT
mmetsp:Transcript_29917/g.75345  ORF Transcript_29917/g.75345 Transcript_29917/m.75345 type:complete len:217 (-) Transcript_29917:1289-1939(-)